MTDDTQALRESSLVRLLEAVAASAERDEPLPAQDIPGCVDSIVVNCAIALGFVEQGGFDMVQDSDDEPPYPMGLLLATPLGTALLAALQNDARYRALEREEVTITDNGGDDVPVREYTDRLLAQAEVQAAPPQEEEPS